MERINQSSVIFFYLLAAFLVFITMRGELRIYMGFLLGGARSSDVKVNPAPASGNDSIAAYSANDRERAAEAADLKQFANVLGTFAKFAV